MIKAKLQTGKTGSKPVKANIAAKRTSGTKSQKPIASLRSGTKLAALIEKLKTNAGSSLDELATATGWQHHSIRGAISGQLKKKLKLAVTSAKGTDGIRRYRIAA